VLAWGISTSNLGYGAGGATGGGTSTFMQAPSWQKSSISPAPSMRVQPDVSMIGDPNTGVTFVTNSRFSGGPGDVGGTSVAAPEMAAVWSLVLSACKANPGVGSCAASGSGHYWRLGNASPYLYNIYSGAARLPYNDVFYDIVYGSNEMQSNNGLPSAPVPGANAMTGYDQTTGVGAPYAGHLIQAITGVTVP
jgi:subtilase family serine protease